MLLGLHFPEASDELVRQLAAHVLHHRVPGEAVDVGAAGECGKDPVAEVIELLPEGVLKRIESGVVSVHPVSRALPRVRLVIDLPRLAEELGVPPLTELSVVPGFRFLCRELIPLFDTLRGTTHCTEPDPLLVPSHLVFVGFETLSEDLMVPMSRRDTRAFFKELSAIVADEVQTPVDYRIVTQIR